MAATAAVGLVLGGWLGLHFEARPAAAPGSAVNVRLDALAHPTWPQDCVMGTTKVPVPLRNYGSATVTVTSVTVDGFGSAVAQPVSVSIPPGHDANVQVLLAPGAQAQDCGLADPISGCQPTAEAALDADFTVSGPSGRNQTVRLPIAAWESSEGQLRPYDAAALAAWSYWITC